MKKYSYSFTRHLSAGLVGGLLFSLALGIIFSVKMIGINESLHDFRLAWPFTLNFIPLYLLLGVLFGVIIGIIGALLMRSGEPRKRMNFFANLGIALVVFMIARAILGVPVGVIGGMLLATMLFITLHGVRPPLNRVYFAVFFTSVMFNYSWQWVRQHWIINPLIPIPNSQTVDLVFTFIWAILALLAFRVFLGPFFKLHVKTIYVSGISLAVILLVVGTIYYYSRPEPPARQIAENLQIEPRPVDHKFLLIGIDGMWWEVMYPLMEQGRMPNVKALVDSGASGELETLFPTFSAMIWTSITTGRSPENHGTTSFLVWKFPVTGYTLPCHITPKITAEIGWFRTKLITEAPITNQFMDVMPFWLMLSDHGKSVGTVNWWLSWPAHEVNGFVVTDHCLYNKSNIMQNYKTKQGLTPYDIYPLELLEELGGFSHGPQDITEAEIRRFINVTDPAFIAEFKAIDTYEYIDIAYEASMFKYSYPEDVTYERASEYLIDNYQPDVMATYLKGLDSMEHQYLKYYFRDEHPDKLIPQNTERYKDLIDNYYIYIDDMIGKFVAAADSNTIVMVVSDHGFDKIMLPTGHYNHMDKPAGVFICSGPGIKQGITIEGAHVYDITPTMLHAMGLPTAQDFDGRVLTEIFETDYPVETIQTYETGRRASRELIESDIDQDYKERLRALGYTQ